MALKSLSGTSTFPRTMASKNADSEDTFAMSKSESKHPQRRCQSLTHLLLFHHRYEEAATLFRSSGLAFPRPTLIFQVLLYSDPRLASASKYHAINALDGKKRIMTVVEYKIKEKEKKRSDESLQEIAKYLATYRAKLSAATPTPVPATPQATSSAHPATPLIDHPYDPVTPTAPISRPASVSSTIREQPMSVSHLFPDLDDVMKSSRSSGSQSTGSLNATRSPGVATPQPQLSPTPEPAAQYPRAAPHAGQPNFANLFTTAAQATTAATSTISSELRSTAIRASHELRSNAMTQGATLTNELKGVLEGFLDHLGGQLATFEDGMREKLDLAGRNVPSGATPPEAHTRRESEGDLRHMPGAFRMSSSADVTAVPTTADASSISVAYKHKNKVCDSCGKAPIGVCFKCNVSQRTITEISTLTS